MKDVMKKGWDWLLRSIDWPHLLTEVRSYLCPVYHMPDTGAEERKETTIDEQLRRSPLSSGTASNNSRAFMTGRMAPFLLKAASTSYEYMSLSTYVSHFVITVGVEK